MEKLPIILLIAFTIGSIISLWVWHSIEKTTDDNEADGFECFENFEDYDIDIENNDDIEFIKYWYS